MATGLRVDGLEKVIATLNKLGKLDEVVEEKLDPRLREFAEEIKSEQMSGPPGLNVVTGNLRGSIQTEIIDSGKSLEFILGSDVDYLAQHEYGLHGLPKRLYIEEEWTAFVENDVLQLIEDSAREILAV